VDALLRGLEPGTITFIDSTDRLVFELVNLFCFNAVNELHEEVLWIDGGNSVNPYELSAICKRYRVPPEEVLHNITVSRAFTALKQNRLTSSRTNRSELSMNVMVPGSNPRSNASTGGMDVTRDRYRGALAPSPMRECSSVSRYVYSIGPHRICLVLRV